MTQMINPVSATTNAIIPTNEGNRINTLRCQENCCHLSPGKLPAESKKFLYKQVSGWGRGLGRF